MSQCYGAPTIDGNGRATGITELDIGGTLYGVQYRVGPSTTIWPQGAHERVCPAGSVSSQLTPTVFTVFDEHMLLRKGIRAKPFELQIDGMLIRNNLLLWKIK